MKRTTKGLKASTTGHVLGARTFAAITAIEGVSLSTASRKRLTDMNKRKLSPDDQRTEVIQAYRGTKSRG